MLPLGQLTIDSPGVRLVVIVRLSVTLPGDLLDAIDRTGADRTAFLEKAARYYLAETQRITRDELDSSILAANADRLNREAVDVFAYQNLA